MLELLLKKFKIINKSIKTKNYNLGWKIYEYIISKPSSVIEFSSEKLANENRYNIFKKDDWVTYDDYRSLEFYIQNDNLFVNIKLFDDGVFDKYVKWTSTIHLSISFLSNIGDLIDDCFDKFCIDRYDDYLLDERKKWIDNYKNSILS